MKTSGIKTVPEVFGISDKNSIVIYKNIDGLGIFRYNKYRSAV